MANRGTLVKGRAQFKGKGRAMSTMLFSFVNAKLKFPLLRQVCRQHQKNTLQSRIDKYISKYIILP